MRVSVVTPDQSYFDGEAQGVTLQAIDGEIGILPRHAPLIARLGHGVARIATTGKTERIAVYGGFVKVQDDVVNVLAGGADTGQDVSAADAQKAIDEATQRLAQVREAGDKASLPEAEEQVRRAQTLHKLVSGS